MQVFLFISLKLIAVKVHYNAGHGEETHDDAQPLDELLLKLEALTERANPARPWKGLLETLTEARLTMLVMKARANHRLHLLLGHPHARLLLLLLRLPSHSAIRAPAHASSRPDDARSNEVCNRTV